MTAQTTKRIILMSHALRGGRWSPERLADLRAARAAWTRLRKDLASEEATVVVPYLLYGEVTEDIVAARVSGQAGYGLRPHTEVFVTGDVHCDGVCAEVLRALEQNLLVRYEHTHALRSAA